jgi:hypothetical protein
MNDKRESTSAAHLPSTGRYFPLATFEAAVQTDAEILGVLYTGSLGAGGTDRYSDLDIDVWVTAEAVARSDGKLAEILALLGPVQFVYSRGPAFVTAFAGPDWQRVDLHLHDPTETGTFAEYACGRIIKDTQGLLARMVVTAPVEPVKPAWEAARAEIEEAIDSVFYATLHNARGEHWSAATEITGHLERLYTLLAGFRGRASYGLRYVSEVATQKEQALLARAWPARAEREEVRRAVGELWKWTRHVWQEAERSLDRSLEIDVNERDLLRAVDDFYGE